MNRSESQIKYRKNELEKLTNIINNPSNYLIIYYSCESFYEDTLFVSPKITSITICNYCDKYTTHFSYAKTASFLNIDSNEIKKNSDLIEKEMLRSFLNFMEKKTDKVWIHWNMRDDKYGFPAIDHRCQIIFNEKNIIETIDKIDLANTIEKLYGENYIEMPKVENLVLLNNINNKDYLNIFEESIAFSEGRYFDLTMSSLRNVNIYFSILTKTLNRTLKTNKSEWSLYGESLLAKWYTLKERPYFVPIFWTLSTILSAMISHFVTKGLK